MDSIQLSGIIIVNAVDEAVPPEFVTGSLIQVFYDGVDSSNIPKYTVKSDGVEFSSGISLNDSRIIEYNRLNSDYVETLPDGTIRTFSPIEGFPYVFAEIEEPKDPEDTTVYDISLSLVSVKNETGVSNGEVELVANGSNPPFRYYKTKPTATSLLTSGQDSGLFSGLSSGTYTFYAHGLGAESPILDVDEINVVVSDGVVLSDEFYGDRWVTEDTSVTGELKYRTRILERGYEGTSSTIKGTSTPFQLSMRGEGQDIYQQKVISSNASINLILEEDIDQFNDIVQADDTKYGVIREKFNGLTYDLMWKGFVNPSSYRDVLYHPPFSASVYATDRLASLNSILLDNGKGLMSQMFVLHLCLSRLNLGLGYRIACNIFEKNHTTDISPLDQTYIESDYFSGDNLKSCGQVVSDIMTIYGATLFSWGGYWYMVRQKEWLNETIDYFEYDENGVYTDTTGSWNPRIDYKEPKETDRFRFINGAQSRIYSNIYGRVTGVQELLYKSDKEALTPGFNFTNAVYSNDPILGQRIIGFKGYQLVTSGDSLRASTIINNSFIDGGSLTSSFDWKLTLNRTEKSQTFLSTTGTLEFNALDNIRIDTSVSVGRGFSIAGSSLTTDFIPYLQLKWSLRVGDLYLTEDGFWTDSEVLNVYFLDNNGESTDVFLEYVLPDTLDYTVPHDYDLRIYGVNHFERENTYSSYDEMVSNIIAIDVANISPGRRLVYGVKESDSDNVEVYYYSLSKYTNTEPKPDGITPNDDTNSRWIRDFFISALDYDNSTGIQTAPTDTNISNVALNFLPNIPLPDNIVRNNFINIRNTEGLNVSFNQFDIAKTFSNKDRILLNFLKLEDGTGTSIWSDDGEYAEDGVTTKTIQDWTIKWISFLVKTARQRVSGNFRVDGLELTPLNVLFNPSDNNRVYLPMGVSSDFKMQQYSGELIEIASDLASELSAFDNSVDQKAFD